jgi:plastocyanin
MKRSSLLALSVLGLALAGCGSSTGSSSTSSSSSAVRVTIKNFAYIPSVIHANVGQTIVWTNEDTPPHNVTYLSGPKFASSPPMMSTGAKFRLTLRQAGTINYYCTIHPWMKGTIVVSP